MVFGEILGANHWMVAFAATRSLIFSASLRLSARFFSQPTAWFRVGAGPSNSGYLRQFLISRAPGAAHRLRRLCLSAGVLLIHAPLSSAS